jgi:hypothetical protein
MTTPMHRPALATLALTLIAGAALAAPPSGDMVFLQGDWQLPGRQGQVLSISGGTGKLAAVDAAAAKAGYAVGDILVQGLTYESVTRFNDGRRTLSYTGVCRSRGDKGAWTVADCLLQVALPGEAGPAVLSATPSFRLIAGQQSSWGIKPVLAGAPKVKAAPGDARPRVAETSSQVPKAPGNPPAPPAPPEDPNDTWARRSMSPEELAAQDAGTRRLNADITARNAAIEARNRQSDAAFKAAQAARDAEIAANQAAHAREIAAYEARLAAREAAIAKARADWEAAVKACKAGDKTKCAQPK